MFRCVLLLTVVLAIGNVSSASALSPQEEKIILKATEQFLDSTPDNNFLLMPEEIFERIKSGAKDFLLVDVRSKKEFENGHLPGAINIQTLDIVAPKTLDRLPKDKEIILYCSSGHESTKILPLLRMLGYNALGMKWGMMAWSTVSSTEATLKAIAKGKSGVFPVEK